MEHVIVKVSGMTCGGCAKKIEGNLGKLDGVDAAVAIVSDGTVNVTFDSVKVTYGHVKQAIRDSGYEVVGQPEEESPSGCSCCR